MLKFRFLLSKCGPNNGKGLNLGFFWNGITFFNFFWVGVDYEEEKIILRILI